LHIFLIKNYLKTKRDGLGYHNRISQRQYLSARTAPFWGQNSKALALILFNCGIASILIIFSCFGKVWYLDLASLII